MKRGEKEDKSKNVVVEKWTSWKNKMGIGGERVDKNGQHNFNENHEKVQMGWEEKGGKSFCIVGCTRRIKCCDSLKREKDWKKEFINLKISMTAVSPSFRLKHRKNENNFEYVLEHNNTG